MARFCDLLVQRCSRRAGKNSLERLTLLRSWEVVRIPRDYVALPKLSGYRAIHEVMNWLRLAADSIAYGERRETPPAGFLEAFSEAKNGAIEWMTTEDET